MGPVNQACARLVPPPLMVPSGASFSHMVPPSGPVVIGPHSSWSSRRAPAVSPAANLASRSDDPTNGLMIWIELAGTGEETLRSPCGVPRACVIAAIMPAWREAGAMPYRMTAEFASWAIEPRSVVAMS